jgi:glutamine amidotransferase
MRVVVVDIGLGNLRSVAKALELAADTRNVKIELSRDPAALRDAAAVVVPGQSRFGAFAQGLGVELREAILERLKAGTPYLGMCLGLQILFEGSEEDPGVAGFGWFKGQVRKLQSAPGLKIPHMGWNQLALHAGGHPCLTAAGGNGAWVYFVHSFHATPSEPEVLKASVDYGPNQVTAAVGRDNVFATQFHPEKSQSVGIALLTSFIANL